MLKEGIGEKEKVVQESKEYKCGIIMPISSVEDYTTQHWLDVKQMIIDTVKSITEIKFEERIGIVSEPEGFIGIIHNDIVQNLATADIIICDISTKNPNVFFELGLRLAFDKPVILIKDDHTDNIFDTGLIRHFEYPRTLHMFQIEKFKTRLKTAVVETIEAVNDNPEKSVFLKHFSDLTVSSQVGKLEPEVVTQNEMLSNIYKELSNLNLQSKSVNKSKVFHPSTRKIISGFIKSFILRQEFPPFFDEGDVISQIRNWDISDVSKSANSQAFKDYLYQHKLNVNEFNNLDILVVFEDTISEMIKDYEMVNLPF